jgi:hypothetical protein
MGLVAGVAVTLVLGDGLLGETGESDTVANAALEAAPAQGFGTRAAEPVAVVPRQPAVVQPTAAEPATPVVAAAPEPARAPEQAAAPEAAPSVAPNAPPTPVPARAEPVVAAAPRPASATVVNTIKQPAPPPQSSAMIDKAVIAAHAPLPGTPQPPPINPTAPKQAPPPVVYQDPNSEDAKLAAAAQVRLKGDTKIDNMLDQALTGEKSAPPTAAPAPAALAQTPSRDDVVSSMSVLVPAIRGCAQGQSGLAPMSIVVLSDGRVESAALSSGPFQGTASGRCMEGVVRRAKFPRFKQANFRVQFPFAVQ